MYTYDDQLMDAVKVRRSRLAQAVLHRDQRLRRTWSDGVRASVASVFLAVVVCAACVAVSFVTHLLATDPLMSRNRTPGVQPAVTAPVSMAPSPSEDGPSPGKKHREKSSDGSERSVKESRSPKPVNGGSGARDSGAAKKPEKENSTKPPSSSTTPGERP